MKRLIDYDDAELIRYLADMVPRGEDGSGPCRFYLVAIGDDSGYVYAVGNLPRADAAQALRQVANEIDTPAKPPRPKKFTPPM